jgi:hypothetical protein
MARRSTVLALAAAITALAPVGANAATAPASPPVLTSAPFVRPATFHWTPASDPANASQGVYRSSGACSQPQALGGPIVTGLPAGQTDFSAGPVDGIYCYHIRTTDLLGGTAEGPGFTVAVDTTAPTATVAIAGQASGGAVGGTVGVVGTSADAVSGVASSTLHVGAVGGCAAGPVIPATWDTTGFADGVYEVCNVVADAAGHVAIARTVVTVSNAVQAAGVVPLPLGGAAPVVAVTATTPAGVHALAPPTSLDLMIHRSKPGAAAIPLTLRWKNPAIPGLARVSVVLNLRHAPRTPSDGRLVYSGLRPSASLALLPGQKGYLALFAFDRSGAHSSAARRIVSLAPLLPLRPVTGSVVESAPRLTWKPRARSEYYNVQLFRNGTRVLVRWPERPSLSLAAARLPPGTYVWYVWPAIRHSGHAPTFGRLIGRATFVLE